MAQKNTTAEKSAGKEQGNDCENGDVKKKKSEAKEEVWDGDKTERWGWK